MLPAQTLKVVLECAGHRRTELDPPAEGIPWGADAVGEARWTGAPLRELLALARPSRRAVAAVLEGADRGPFAHPAGEFSFARCLPLANTRSSRRSAPSGRARLVRDRLGQVARPD